MVALMRKARVRVVLLFGQGCCLYRMYLVSYTWRWRNHAWLRMEAVWLQFGYIETTTLLDGYLYVTRCAYMKLLLFNITVSGQLTLADMKPTRIDVGQVTTSIMMNLVLLRSVGLSLPERYRADHFRLSHKSCCVVVYAAIETNTSIPKPMPCQTQSPNRRVSSSSPHTRPFSLPHHYQSTPWPHSPSHPP